MYSVKNYFEFFGLPISFSVDESLLKKKYLVNCREYHPDHFTLEDQDVQAKMLELSSYNNLAFNTLVDVATRMAYVLQLKGLLGEEGKEQLPQAFLAEMMEVNEALMELESEPAPSKVKALKEHVEEIEKALDSSIQPVLEKSENQEYDTEELEKVKEVYLKKKYLWRIKENLDKFAAASKEAG